MTTAPLPYFETHAGHGPHLLLVHGFLSSRAQWRPNLAALTQFTRPVIVELWGHGRSPAPEDDAVYELAYIVEALDRVRRAVGAERWFVCGQSYGAGLATHYAARHSAVVDGLVLTNSISAFSPPADPDRRAVQRERIAALQRDGRTALEAQRIYPVHAKRLPEDAKAEMVDDAAGISVESVIRSWRVTGPDLSALEEMSRLPLPLLIVNGLWEKRFQLLLAKARPILRNASVVELEGGHSINMEAAAGFNTAVERFVREHAARH